MIKTKKNKVTYDTIIAKTLFKSLLHMGSYEHNTNTHYYYYYDHNSRKVFYVTCDLSSSLLDGGTVPR